MSLKEKITAREGRVDFDRRSFENVIGNPDKARTIVLTIDGREVFHAECRPHVWTDGVIFWLDGKFSE